MLFFIFFFHFGGSVIRRSSLLTPRRTIPPGYFLANLSPELASAKETNSCGFPAQVAYNMWTGTAGLLRDHAGAAPETTKHMKIAPGQNEDPLDQPLRAWQVNTTLPPRFQEHVWRRIADADAENTTTTLWSVIRNRCQLAFARPSVAVACAVVLLFIGSGTGYLQARHKSGLIENSLSQRYIQSLDPYQKTGM
jgi:hypothetical protein